MVSSDIHLSRLAIAGGLSGLLKQGFTDVRQGDGSRTPSPQLEPDAEVHRLTS